ncbi:MAG TPA: enolase C-terminal domain-like protein [Acidobacteriaceae bacterium]|nr:enolase C-terminal domain-like protein [Acidobacteriaceae bacterium]
MLQWKGRIELQKGSIEEAGVSAYTIPTDAPEADGTLSWDSTTLVLAELRCGGITGIGYTYGTAAVAILARHLAEKCLLHQAACDIPALHASLLRQVRNDGNVGIGAMAVSALDIALWDLKAKLLGRSLVDLLGAADTRVEAYGSGGFTSYSDKQLAKQLSGWVKDGIRSVKMKIGTEPERDPERVRVARKAIGPDTALFVDANGAYTAKQSIALADRFAESGVTWFEEPVSSDYPDDLRRVRDAVPAGMDVAAGEYGYSPAYFRHMLASQAVDVLQLDATRCRGFTGFLAGAAIAASFGCPMSAHCAPSLHMHVARAVPGFRNVEYFHDHVRIEKMLFDGFIPARNGFLEPDRARPGLGLIFKRKDAERFAV